MNRLIGLWIALLTGVGCGSGSGGIATGAGGAAGFANPGIGGGGATGAGAARTCQSTSDERCSCVEGQPDAADPECSSTSVETRTGDVGVCCQGGVFCDCTAYVCKNYEGLGYCACGASPTITATIPGAVVSVCPANAQQICCYSPELNDCTCSILACDNGRIQVATCSLADVVVCAEHSFRVDRCSSSGGGGGGAHDAFATKFAP